MSGYIAAVLREHAGAAKKNATGSKKDGTAEATKKDDGLVDRYEQIRQAFLDRHQAVTMWGLAVLKKKGMAAWTKSWRQYSEGGAKQIPFGPPVTVASSHLPANSEAVVRVLVSMVWAVEKETVRC